MLPRFLGAIDAASATARLAEDEARHLSQVLRLRAGDEVTVFDGAGREFRARIERVSREGADLALLDESAAAAEPAVRLTLAQAVLKGDKMDGVVRDATMMGVRAIEPLITAHTVAHLKPGGSPERWRRIAIASAKQCRRAVLPSIGPGTTLDDWLARDAADMKLILVEPAAAERAAEYAERAEGAAEHAEHTERAAEHAAEYAEYADHAERAAESKEHAARATEYTERTKWPTKSARSASLLVGPEGGWSADEIARARGAGYRPLTLGRRTLRADAVPVVAISVLQFLWGDL